MIPVILRSGVRQQRTERPKNLRNGLQDRGARSFARVRLAADLPLRMTLAKGDAHTVWWVA